MPKKNKNTKHILKAKQLYNMLCWCVDELQYFNIGDIDIDDNASTPELLAALFTKSFDILYTNKYFRDYTIERVVTDKPTGKILLDESKALGYFDQGKLLCEIEKLNLNTLMNKVIKAAANVLLHPDVQEQISEELILKVYWCRDQLRSVDDVEVTKWLLNDIINVPEWYKPNISVCKMIFELWLATEEIHKSDSDEEDMEEPERLLVLDDNSRMPYIWEKFLRNYIAKTYPMYNTSKPVLYESNGDEVEPDIFIVDDSNKMILILDAKWYADEKNSKANRYKMRSYCTIACEKQNGYEEYKVFGLNVYASMSNTQIKNVAYLDTCDGHYSDSWVNVNVEPDTLTEEVCWLVTNGYILENNKSYSFK